MDGEIKVLTSWRKYFNYYKLFCREGPQQNGIDVGVTLYMGPGYVVVDIKVGNIVEGHEGAEVQDVKKGGFETLILVACGAEQTKA